MTLFEANEWPNNAVLPLSLQTLEKSYEDY